MVRIWLVSIVVAGLVVATSVSASAVTWPAPVAISAAGHMATLAHVAVAPDGTTTAVWPRSNGSNYIVQGATRAPGGSWLSPADLSATGQNTSDPQVAIAPDGTAVAVWERYNGSYEIVQATTRPAGGVWQNPVDLSLTGQSALYPRLAIAPDGTALVVWERSNGTYEIIQAATRPAGGVWQSPVDLSANGASADGPQIAVAPDGTATAVWDRSNGSNNIVQAATRPAGGSWQAPADLSATGRSAYAPQVAVAPDGTATAVWFRYNGSNEIIQAATRPTGGSWQATVDLSATGQSASTPQIAVGPDGTATAVWYRYNGSNEIIQAATRPASGSWQAPADLSATGQSAYDPQIAAAPDGTVIAVWERSTGTNLVVQAATRPAGGAWQSPADLSSGPQDAQTPQIATGADGTTAAVWEQSDGSNILIRATVLDKAFAKPVPPTAPPTTVAPVVATGAIKGPRTIRRPHRARFTFTASLPGATFQCRLDRARKWKACGSPYRLTTRRLKRGRHVLHVRAVLHGIADPTPSGKRFKVR